MALVKDLGVWLDETLSFKLHVNSVINQTLKILGTIHRLTRGFDGPACLRALYCCLVRPILEYASVVWALAGITDMDRIEPVQKRFTRMTICDTTRRMNIPVSDYNKRCQMLRLETIKTRFS